MVMTNALAKEAASAAPFFELDLMQRAPDEIMSASNLVAICSVPRHVLRDPLNGRAVGILQ
jgi:hypothetical protein